MKINNSKKFYLCGMTDADYREGIINLMCVLEKHSEEFKSPEQLVALVHEYSELITTLWSLDSDNPNNYEDDTEDDIDEEAEDDEAPTGLAILMRMVFDEDAEDQEEDEEEGEDIDE